jgi:broad specificity phosphatase PhoE
MKIKIIRHSERFDFSYPHWWLFYFGHYWSDTPLTTRGHGMAKTKGEDIAKTKFNPKHIYSSPYIRTMETAAELKHSFPDAEIIVEPLLSEYQPYLKHNITLFPSGIPTKTHTGNETDFSFPETYEKHVERVKFIIRKIIEKHDYSDEVLIVTHGEVLKTYCEYLNDLFPSLLLNLGSTPYLATISLEVDADGKIIEDSIQKE